MAGERVLVPVSRSPTLRPTVEHAVDRALDGATPDAPGVVRFVFVHSPMTGPSTPDPDAEADEAAAEELLDRVRVWAQEDAGDEVDGLQVQTAHLGGDEYLFGPDDVAAVLREDALAADVRTVVMDPEYDPGVGAPLITPLESALARAGDLTVVEAPVEPRTRRAPILSRATPLRLGALFGVSFLFYQLLAGTPEPFDLVTGAVAGTTVAAGLSRVSFVRDPDRVTPVRLLRGCLYLPYLLVQIVKANVQVAAVILDPRLPIEPCFTRIRPAVWGPLPVTTLANSITLTPGTLTVRIEGQSLLVHTLVAGAREDLFDGGLERAVRFVFFGRRAARIESLRERGDAEIVAGPEGTATEADATGGDAAGAADATTTADATAADAAAVSESSAAPGASDVTDVGGGGA